MQTLELTILMPCLNEAETLATCIEKAQRFLRENQVEGEVLIADNGSDDGSLEIARKAGARVIEVPQRGYGAALIAGSEAAYGRYVIMGDADDSYDFLSLMPFLERLRQGDDLVMGNRFRGGIEKGAMPPLHRYLGNPVLSFLGRVFFPSKIGDFHCGLRGYHTEAMQALDLRTTGMEYASEMVVQATLHGLTMSEVPTKLYPDGRTRAPHLRSFRDGWRHLKFLLMHSPNWLFLYPGLVFAGLGLLMMALLLLGPLVIRGISFDINTLLYSCLLIAVGVNMVLFFVYTKVYASETSFIPLNQPARLVSRFTAEKGTLVGSLLVVLGIALSIGAVYSWGQVQFQDLDPERMMRLTIPAVFSILLGIQLIFAGFFVDILRIKRRK